MLQRVLALTVNVQVKFVYHGPPRGLFSSFPPSFLPSSLPEDDGGKKRHSVQLSFSTLQGNHQPASLLLSGLCVSPAPPRPTHCHSFAHTQNMLNLPLAMRSKYLGAICREPGHFHHSCYKSWAEMRGLQRPWRNGDIPDFLLQTVY